MSSILSEAELAPAGNAPPQTAGAFLRAARNAQGLHIAALAAQLKVPQVKLEALEADRYQDLPDTTFVRALAKAMCRALKIDAAPVLALLPRGGEPELDRVSRGLNAPFRERAVRDEAVSVEWLKRPVFWGPAGLLLAALLVYLMPSGWLAPSDATPTASAAAGADASVLLESAEAEAAAPASLQAGQVEPTQTAQPAASAVPLPAVAASVAAAVAQPALAAAASTTVPAVAQPAPAGAVPLRVRVHAESWVEVTDARGQVLLSKLMRPSEQAELAVLPPLRLRVGNVAGTEITLRGAAVDLAGQAKDNVARLELN